MRDFATLRNEWKTSISAVMTGHLYTTGVTKEALWDTYISSFPEQAKQEFTCNSCKQFIRQYGNIVKILDNKLVTFWDFNCNDPEWQTVFDNMKGLVLSAPVTEAFVSKHAKLGTESNLQLLEDKSTIRWNHFSFTLDRSQVTRSSSSEEQIMGERRDTKNVLKRGLDELTISATETVLELIAQNSLYRGAEFQGVLTAFLALQKEYADIPADEKNNYCWTTSATNSVAICRIRNTSIGTLLIDISEGVLSIDDAVAKFERVMAPANYKRPTAILTSRMIADAETKIKELGFTDSLARRFAVPEDITVDNVLFVYRPTEQKATGVFEDLKASIPAKPANFSRTEQISFADFITKVLPTTTKLELLFENRHLSNLVSLIAAANPEAPTLFKWDNPFSWTYAGSVADSLKEKVKAAGGKIDGEIRISLEWFNFDDLDLHVKEPGGTTICFRERCSRYSGGRLDVDMNAGSDTTRTPVENIIFPELSRMQEGRYKVMVHNYNLRDKNDPGFSVEIECRGELHTFSFTTSPGNYQYQTIAEFDYSKKTGLKMITETKPTVVTRQAWGIETNKFYNVNLLLPSPNYWGTNQVGNKHTFFILEDCKNPETNVCGFFNEFLKQELLEHKRVFEALAGKMKVEPSDRQLSGIGFSSTQKDEFVCRVSGSFNRTLKVVL